MELTKHELEALPYGSISALGNSREAVFTSIAVKAAILNSEHEIELRKKIESDALTNLLNKNGITSRIENWMQANRHFGILLCDLTNFKKLNDSKGHLAGDEFLQKTANIINFALRTNDEIGRITTRDHEASRWGGDEFVILLDLTPHDDLVMEPNERLQVVEERITNIFNDYLEEAGLNNSGFGITIGSEVYSPEFHLSPSDVITAADLNMLSNKVMQHEILGKHR